MSGGSYDYAYIRVLNFRDELRLVDGNDQKLPPTIEVARVQLANHLTLVADALHAVEWVDSGDSAPGEEVEPIRKMLVDGTCHSGKHRCGLGVTIGAEERPTRRGRPSRGGRGR